MKRSEMIFGLLRIPLDALAMCAALLLAYRLREARVDLIPGVQLLEPAATLPTFDWYVQTFMIPSVAVFIILAAILRLYALKTTRGAWNEVGRSLAASILWLTLVIAWFFLVEKQLFYSRILLLHATAFLSLFVVLLRSCVVLIQRSFLKSGIGVRSVLSVGHAPLAMAALETLQQDIRYHYLGHCRDLSELQRSSTEPDFVIQTDPSPQSDDTVALIEYCRSTHIGYAFLPPVFTDVPHLLAVDRLGLMPMLRFQPTPLDGWGRVWKRLFDVVVSLIAIIILSPLMMIIALMILFSMGWPVFFVSRRVGDQGKKQIGVLKFRSMVRNAEDLKPQLLDHNERSDGPLFKLTDDPRITPLGKILRRFDLDELPQLFNVLFGQMSLVGPRPHLPEEVSRYAPHERRVFAVRPGMTGLSQVSGRSALKFEDEVRLDMQYIEEWSPLLDIWVLWRTVVVVVAGKSRG